MKKEINYTYNLSKEGMGMILSAVGMVLAAVIQQSYGSLAAMSFAAVFFIWGIILGRKNPEYMRVTHIEERITEKQYKERKHG